MYGRKREEGIRQAYFTKDGVTFPLHWVPETEMDKIRTDPETGLERLIVGYPSYYTESKRLYPIPIEGIKVIYDE